MFKRDTSPAEPQVTTPAVDSPSAKTAPLQGALQLQRAVGNHAVQRLVDGASFDELLAARRGAGSPLVESARAFLEPRLGNDLGAVRVHIGAQAHELAGAAGATAFTTGPDIYFRDGAYDPQSEDGLRLLAHEVTHVLQQSRGPVAGTPVDGGVAISDPSDAFEQEADRVAAEVMSPSAASPTGVAVESPGAASSGAGDAGGVAVQREEDDDGGWLGGLGKLVESAGSEVASAASSVVDAGSSVVSQAGSALADGAQSIASGASDVAEGAWQGAKGAAGVVSDFVGDTYKGMKQNAGYVKEGEGLVDSGIDWLEDKAKGGVNWAASQAKGIPVVEQLASAGASSIDDYIDFNGGLLKGATGLAGGVLGAVADPVDTVKGLWSMGEHIPVLGEPAKMMHGAYDMAFSDKSAAQIADETLNPMADAKYWGSVGSALWQPYAKSISEGKGAEAAGRGVFDIGTLLLGFGEAGGAAKAADLAKVADVADASRLADLADAGKVADASKGADVADAAKGIQIPVEPGAASDLRGIDVRNIGKPTGELAGLTDAEIDAFVDGIDGNAQALGDKLRLVPYSEASAGRASLLADAKELAAKGLLESEGTPAMKALAEGKPVEAMHILPQSVGESIPGYSGENALTMLEDKPIHRLADKDWIKEFKDLAKADETTSVNDVRKTIEESFQGSEQSQGAKNSLKYRLQDEMAELGLDPMDEIQPYRDRVRPELPPGVEELDFDRPPPAEALDEPFATDVPEPADPWRGGDEHYLDEDELIDAIDARRRRK